MKQRSVYKIIGLLIAILTFSSFFSMSKADTITSNVYIKDVDTNNKIVAGFEYQIEDIEGHKIDVPKIETGIHEIALPVGKNYKLIETKTVEGYQKANDLGFILSKDGLNIYPKHKKADKDNDCCGPCKITHDESTQTPSDWYKTKTSVNASTQTPSDDDKIERKDQSTQTSKLDDTYNLKQWKQIPTVAKTGEVSLYLLNIGWLLIGLGLCVKKLKK